MSSDNHEPTQQPTDVTQVAPAPQAPPEASAAQADAAQAGAVEAGAVEAGAVEAGAVEAGAVEAGADVVARDGTADVPPAKRGWSSWQTTAATVAGLSVAFWLGGRCAPEPVPVSDEAGAQDSDEHGHKGGEEVWTCSMHPQIRMDKPGQCPICGMDLVPAQADVPEADGKGGGAPRVVLSARAQALAKVKTTEVKRTEPRTDVRLLGRVDYDETRLRMVTPWAAGRIDRLKVRVTGARVRKGQTVATLYSPEVYAAMRDLVVAAKQSEKLSGGLHGAANLAASAVNAARQRLRLLGVSKKQVASIERAKKAPSHISIRSTFSGTVLKRMVEEGDYVKAGTALFHLADLSRVWVQIDAYESDLPHLTVGQQVMIRIDSLPEETFEGKVAFIDPIVDAATRTARVRVEVANPDGQLRPGMFAEAIIEADIGRQQSHLVIPTTAPLFTGRRSVVYVEAQDTPGTYELREVRLGPKAGPVYPVVSGLSEGEFVVSHGAFAIDADLQLKGGRSMMTRSDDRAVVENLGVPVTAAILSELTPVVQGYLSAKSDLANDDFNAARAKFTELARIANDVKMTGPRATRKAWKKIASALVGKSRQAATAKEDSDVRVAFEHVSMQLTRILELFGNPTEQALYVAFCPMAFDKRGAQWVQDDEVIANPYYGTKMASCGDVRSTLLAGERLGLAQETTVEVTPAPAAAQGHQH